MRHIKFFDATGTEYTYRQDLIERYPEVGYGNFQKMLEQMPNGVRQENRIYYPLSEVVTAINSFLAARNAKKNKKN